MGGVCKRSFEISYRDDPGETGACGLDPAIYETTLHIFGVLRAWVGVASKRVSIAHWVGSIIWTARIRTVRGWRNSA